MQYAILIWNTQHSLLIEGTFLSNRLRAFLAACTGGQIKIFGWTSVYRRTIDSTFHTTWTLKRIYRLGAVISKQYMMLAENYSVLYIYIAYKNMITKAFQSMTDGSFTRHLI